MEDPNSINHTPAQANLGFGSLHFQATEDAPQWFSGAEYLDWIEQEIRRLPGAAVIDVSTSDDAYAEFLWPSPGSSEQYRDSGVPYPSLQFCSIKFGLKIPVETQVELVDDLKFGGARSDDFIVSIRDGWQMPTAMVWPFGSDTSGDGSTAVQVVREYFRREIASSAVSPIEFDCLGPSPAHFTVELVEGKGDQTDGLQLVRRDPRPYPNYVFAYSPNLYELADAVDGLHFELSSQLDLIYRIESARHSQLRDWDRAEESSRRILSAYEAVWPKGSLRRLVQGRNIGRVQIALVELELNQTLNHKRLTREFESEYVDAPEVDIEQVVRDKLQGFETLQVEPLARLMEALAASRQTGRAVLIAAVASLIGAAVAAVATLIAS